MKITKNILKNQLKNSHNYWLHKDQSLDSKKFNIIKHLAECFAYYYRDNGWIIREIQWNFSEWLEMLS